MLTVATALLLATATATTAGAAEDTAWGYYPTPAFVIPAGSGAYLTPQTWRERFPLCGGTDYTGKRSSGDRQSPIDFSQVPVDLNLQPIQMRTYLPFTGISLLAVPQKQLRIYLETESDSFTRDLQNGIQYVLKYIDVKSPSEHTFGGARRDVELQFMHEVSESEGISSDDPRFRYAVSATYLAGEGSKSGFLDTLFLGAIAYMEDEQQNGRVAYNYTVSRNGAVADMPPISRDYFRYEGSLTTPPCTENIVWNVYANPIFMSRAQLSKIRHLLGLPDIVNDAVFNSSGATGAGDRMSFEQALGNDRCIAYVPESLQPLLDSGNIYSEQRYATTRNGRKRPFTQTEIRDVRMFKEYVGDDLLTHKIEKLSANELADDLAIAGICGACGGVLLAFLAWLVSRV